MKILKGITWNHTRGILPLQAAAQLFHESNPDVEIVWEKRSLQAFADAPLESMNEKYDFMVIDHPHVGDAAAKDLILPFNKDITKDLYEDVKQNSVGLSFESYVFDDELWELPIDAATPVAVYRDDLMKASGKKLPETWEDVMELAKGGFVVMPAIGLNTLMDFYMLSLSLGGNLFANGRVVEREIGRQAMNEIKAITEHIPDWCAKADPIAVHRYLSSSEKEFYCPAAYGYSAYSMLGYGKHLLKGAPCPSRNGKPMSSTLGGTGLAISNKCRHRETAFQFASLAMSEMFQKSLYVSSGGQPGHAKAWKDSYTNRLTGDYFLDTLPGLESAYLRPRYAGYVDFQDFADKLMFAARWEGKAVEAVLDEIDKFYETSKK